MRQQMVPPKIGVPPFIIDFNGILLFKPSIFGSSIYGTPLMSPDVSVDMEKEGSVRVD